MAFVTSVLAAAAIGLMCLYLIRQLVTISSLPLPPGPRPLPVIGNVHQAPKSHAWLQFAKWGKEYGPIFYMSMLGKPLIVLSTSQAAHELLAKRGATFSDRAPLFVCHCRRRDVALWTRGCELIYFPVGSPGACVEEPQRSPDGLP